MSYRLSVPYAEKDQAKALGARWNFREKYWYCEELTDGLKRWYRKPLEPVPQSKDDMIDLSDYKSVSEVSDMIINKYFETPEFQTIMVRGEVTNYSGHTNHYYFDIKDSDAILKCFMYESVGQNVLNFELANGQQVALIGCLDLYRATGKSQLKVSSIINIGEGAAMLEFLRLKARLEAEGLFLQDHKKPISKYPEKVGIITSKSGQAIKDICKVAGKRNPYVLLELYHVNVQGKNAVSTIVSGIKFMDARGYDTIIVGRGGGSDEELMAYNDEAIARAVYEAQTPIISAVGHEGHWTLIDYVADKRVATPSEAAEESVPDIMVHINKVNFLNNSIRVNMLGRLKQIKLILNERKAELEKNSPERRLKEQRAKLEFLSKQISDNMIRLTRDKQNRLTLLSERISANMLSSYKAKKHRFEMLVERLNGLSPTAKLVRGFGYISCNDKPVTTVEDVKAGDSIVMRIHDGQINANVTDVKKG